MKCSQCLVTDNLTSVDGLLLCANCLAIHDGEVHDKSSFEVIRDAVVKDIVKKFSISWTVVGNHAPVVDADPSERNLPTIS